MTIDIETVVTDESTKFKSASAVAINCPQMAHEAHKLSPKIINLICCKTPRFRMYSFISVDKLLKTRLLH